MRPNVFITGASGFVGRAVVRELLLRGYDVTALVHQRQLPFDSVRSVRADLFDLAALARAAEGCSCLIHLVGIIREQGQATFERLHVEATRNIVSAAGIRRLIHMSALGTRADAPAAYHRTKFAAEKIVRDSSAAWTIFRPSLILGPEGEFVRMMRDWIESRAAPYWFMPYFARGAIGLGGGGLIQPLRVDDVARAFVDAIENERSIGKSYDLVGPERISWPELYRRFAASAGRRKAVLPIPAWYAKLLTRILPAKLLPFNRDQVSMSLEDNTGDPAPFITDFGWKPQPVNGFMPARDG